MKGVSKEYNEEGIKLNVKASTKVLKVERIKRRGTKEDELIDTNNIKVTVKKKTPVPHSLKIYGYPSYTATRIVKHEMSGTEEKDADEANNDGKGTVFQSCIGA